jgi:hypothetical protein
VKTHRNSSALNFKLGCSDSNALLADSHFTQTIHMKAIFGRRGVTSELKLDYMCLHVLVLAYWPATGSCPRSGRCS